MRVRSLCWTLSHRQGQGIARQAESPIGLAEMDSILPGSPSWAVRGDGISGTESGADLTNVGSYTGSASPNGTFDQGGNAAEWNETIAEPAITRGVRGGTFGLADPV